MDRNGCKGKDYLSPNKQYFSVFGSRQKCQLSSFALNVTFNVFAVIVIIGRWDGVALDHTQDDTVTASNYKYVTYQHFDSEKLSSDVVNTCTEIIIKLTCHLPFVICIKIIETEFVLLKITFQNYGWKSMQKLYPVNHSLLWIITCWFKCIVCN